MYIRNAYKLGKNLIIIHPGEFYVTNKNEYIGTLLGSCVAVCLYDKINKVGGMNHFMLPGRVTNSHLSKVKKFFHDDDKELLKYGTISIQRLINEMGKYGQRENFVAKIFGGGKVLDFEIKTKYGISNMNLRIAKIILEFIGIPIVSQNIGGDFARKIIFDVSTGKVFCKKIKKIKQEENIILGLMNYEQNKGSNN